MQNLYCSFRGFEPGRRFVYVEDSDTPHGSIERIEDLTKLEISYLKKFLDASTLILNSNNKELIRNLQLRVFNKSIDKDDINESIKKLNTPLDRHNDADAALAVYNQNPTWFNSEGGFNKLMGLVASPDPNEFIYLFKETEFDTAKKAEKQNNAQFEEGVNVPQMRIAAKLFIKGCGQMLAETPNNSDENNTSIDAFADAVDKNSNLKTIREKMYDAAFLLTNDASILQQTHTNIFSAHEPEAIKLAFEQLKIALLSKNDQRPDDVSEATTSVRVAKRTVERSVLDQRDEEAALSAANGDTVLRRTATTPSREYANPKTDGYSAAWNTTEKTIEPALEKGTQLSPKEEVQLRNEQGLKLRKLDTGETTVFAATGKVINVENIDFAEVTYPEGNTSKTGYVALKKMTRGEVVAAAPAAAVAAVEEAAEVTKAADTIPLLPDFSAKAALLPEILDKPKEKTADELALAINEITGGIKNGLYPFITDAKFGKLPQILPQNINPIPGENEKDKPVVAYILDKKDGVVTYINSSGTEDPKPVDGFFDTNDYDKPNTTPNDKVSTARIAYLANLYEVISNEAAAEKARNIETYKARKHPLDLTTNVICRQTQGAEKGSDGKSRHRYKEAATYPQGTILEVVGKVVHKEKNPDEDAPPSDKEINVTYYEVLDVFGNRSYIKPTETDIAKVEPTSAPASAVAEAAPVVEAPATKVPATPKGPEIRVEDRYDVTGKIPHIINKPEQLGINETGFEGATDDEVLTNAMNELLEGKKNGIYPFISNELMTMYSIEGKAVPVNANRVSHVPDSKGAETIGIVISQQNGVVSYVAKDGKFCQVTIPSGDTRNYMKNEDWGDKKDERTQFLRELYGQFKGSIDASKQEKDERYKKAPKLTLSKNMAGALGVIIKVPVKDSKDTEIKVPDKNGKEVPLTKEEIGLGDDVVSYKTGAEVAILAKGPAENQYRVSDKDGNESYMIFEPADLASMGKSLVENNGVVTLVEAPLDKYVAGNIELAKDIQNLAPKQLVKLQTELRYQLTDNSDEIVIPKDSFAFVIKTYDTYKDQPKKVVQILTSDGHIVDVYRDTYLAIPAAGDQQKALDEMKTNYSKMDDAAKKAFSEAITADVMSARYTLDREATF